MSVEKLAAFAPPAVTLEDRPESIVSCEETLPAFRVPFRVTPTTHRKDIEGGVWTSGAYALDMRRIGRRRIKTDDTILLSDVF